MKKKDGGNKVIIFPSKKFKVAEEFLPPGKIYAFIIGNTNISFLLKCFDKPHEIVQMKWGDNITILFRKGDESKAMENLKAYERMKEEMNLSKEEVVEMFFAHHLKEIK